MFSEIWDQFWSWLLNTVSNPCVDKLLIDYTHNGVKYTIPVKITNNVKTIFSAIGEDGKDYTTTVIRFSGPSQDFHGMNLTPNDMGLNQTITIVDIYDEYYEFGQTDIVELSSLD